METPTTSHRAERSPGPRRTWPHCGRVAVVDDAASLFARSFGGEPDGVWSAPGRVNLIGEHTDYNGGLALPIALPQRTYAAVRLRDDGLLRVVSTWLPAASSRSRSADVAPGSPGLGGLRRRGAGSWPRRGTRSRASTCASPATCRSGRGCRARRPSSAPSPRRLSDLLGLGLLADDAGRAAGRGVVPARRERHRRRPDRRDGPGRLDARPRAATRSSSTAARARSSRCRSTSGATASRCSSSTPGREHALVDGQYAGRRATCEAGGADCSVSRPCARSTRAPSTPPWTG